MAIAAVDAFDRLFGGPHAGHRAVHAKGIMLQGEFSPSEEAPTLSRADHFRTRVPVVVRFSDFAGIPAIPDNAAASSPRGMAIKFMLPDGGDTDIVAHSYDGFPAATGEDFVAFLRAAAAPDTAVLNAYLAAHPAAHLFATTPKPAPASYATERFFGVNAFRFTNGDGASRFGRYRLEPAAGAAHLPDAEAARQPPDYLASDLKERLARGPVQFRLVVQLAGPDDDPVDGSKAWPGDGPTVEAGVLTLTALVPGNEAAQRDVLFTPLSLTAGIAPSADPLLVARSRSYRISFDRRRGAEDEPAASVTQVELRR